jgi:hypothetical protein
MATRSRIRKAAGRAWKGMRAPSFGLLMVVWGCGAGRVTDGLKLVVMNESKTERAEASRAGPKGANFDQRLSGGWERLWLASLSVLTTASGIDAAWAGREPP